MNAVGISVAKLWTYGVSPSGGTEREPLSRLGGKKNAGHIHGRLNIEIGGRSVPHLDRGRQGCRRETTSPPYSSLFEQHFRAPIRWDPDGPPRPRRTPKGDQRGRRRVDANGDPS
jgi:hypothetical protein